MQLMAESRSESALGKPRMRLVERVSVKGLGEVEAILEESTGRCGR